jgi:uncharacterized protein
VVHGLEWFGWDWLEHEIEVLAETAAHALPAAAGFVGWAVKAALDGIFGLALGIALIPPATRVIGPLWARLTGKAAAH